ncbi:7TM GPCR, serpentine receptor class ab (Srab) family-containing protein [Strongyloides ratti]|uniref:7TM GPCR, serpentine receptor class ab (Srab) family-containing protein n=1 Tax=Strongyloides ratti TaxID=34506 RepID=A0A090KZG1_STRRB|nr:7TM GPCR, serpentine receptor class ab (Srab) family-containing protein [Strongyloides ratti]CEF62811.1 7TM GPCR, serpentine receptor class ab (Srab) family-containing protein [Strongyloides ratti]
MLFNLIIINLNIIFLLTMELNEFTVLPIRIPIIENCTNFLGLIFIILFFKHLVNFKHYHINIRIMLITMLIYFIFIISSRFLIFLALLEGKILRSVTFGSQNICFFFFLIHRVGFLGYNSIFYIIVIERTIASIRYKTYENEKKKLLCITIVCLHSLTIFVIMFFRLREFAKNNKEINRIPCLRRNVDNGFLNVISYVILIMTTISSLTFFILLIINKKLYIKSNLRFSKNILSTKYQILENLLFLKALLPCILNFLISSVLNGMLFIYIISELIKGINSLEKEIYIVEMGQISDIIFSISFVTIPLTTYITFKRLKKMYLKKNNHNLYDVKKQKVPKNNQIQPTTVNDIYFNQFNKQWDCQKPKK